MIVKLAWIYFCHHLGRAALGLLVGAMAVATVEIVLIVQRAVPDAVRTAYGPVDMVVGPKGAALDLALCCVLHVAEPRGLISYQAAVDSLRGPMVRALAPLALGDSFGGWRIAGTSREIFSLYRATFAEGQAWQAPFEAVLGAEAARALGLSVGAHFVGTHGLGEGGEAHDAHAYHVAGILTATGTALDRLILTDLESIYLTHTPDAVHEDDHADSHDEQAAARPKAVNAVLVSFKTPVALASLSRKIDETPDMSAANMSLELARVKRAAEPLLFMFFGVGLLLGLIATAAAALMLAATMNDRVADLALLRILGASPQKLAGVAMIEAAMYGVGAGAIGLLVAFAVVQSGAIALASRTGLVLTPGITGQDILLIAGGLVVAVLFAGVSPALWAVRTSPEKVLRL